jgi:7,8-dihydropterin-6-yl-methyl-4-(beta-D-ribofuranosyl)aminobenzene 5'-phosphate synthase
MIETARGWVVITGCSHPGIANILDRAADILQGPIYMVMGGFHMLDQTSSEIEQVIDQFRNHHVIQCAATHCTGDEAIRLFKEAFQENFLRLGAGKVISIPEGEKW